MKIKGDGDRLTAGGGKVAAKYALVVTRDPEEVAAAQRLRRDLLTVQYGMALPTEVDGLDRDEFDELCTHLIVRENASGDVVATCRVFPPGVRERTYSSKRFDLSALREIRPAMLELSRVGVRADHRDGGVVAMLATAVFRLAREMDCTWIAGVPFVSLKDGGVTAASIEKMIIAEHLAPARLRVTPLQPWQSDGIETHGEAEIPQPLRHYLRISAMVCGAPSHDTVLGVADFFVLLDTRGRWQR